MKKALIVRLSVAVVVAMSATTWAQEEVQPSLSDNAAATEMAPPEPVMMDSSFGSSCGCDQTMMQPMMANCGGCSTMSRCERNSCTTNTCMTNTCMTNNCMTNSCMTNVEPASSCDDCGMIAQVAYEETVPGTPAKPVSIVTPAPTPTAAMAQPIANAGCCGNTTSAPASTITPVNAIPASTATVSEGVYWGNTCTNCTQSRRFFGRRIFRRR